MIIFPRSRKIPIALEDGTFTEGMYISGCNTIVLPYTGDKKIKYNILEHEIGHFLFEFTNIAEIRYLLLVARIEFYLLANYFPDVEIIKYIKYLSYLIQNINKITKKCDEIVAIFFQFEKLKKRHVNYSKTVLKYMNELYPKYQKDIENLYKICTKLDEKQFLEPFSAIITGACSISSPKDSSIFHNPIKFKYNPNKRLSFLINYTLDLINKKKITTCDELKLKLKYVLGENIPDPFFVECYYPDSFLKIYEQLVDKEFNKVQKNKWDWLIEMRQDYLLFQYNLLNKLNNVRFRHREDHIIFEQQKNLKFEIKGNNYSNKLDENSEGFQWWLKFINIDTIIETSILSGKPLCIFCYFFKQALSKFTKDTCRHAEIFILRDKIAELLFKYKLSPSDLESSLYIFQ